MTNGPTTAPEQPWTPDVEVTPALAASLIAEQFADLAGAAITTLATGWDNTAFAVDDRWLFSFPRRAIAVPGVRREIEVLPRLAPMLPLPIPNPVFVGQPTDRYGWPFFGAALLPGRELADSALPDSERIGAAPSLASAAPDRAGRSGRCSSRRFRRWPRPTSSAARLLADTGPSAAGPGPTRHRGRSARFAVRRRS